jgi:hypothetical protein
MGKFGELSPKSFYAKHMSDRLTYEDTAERISKKTIPYIMVQKGSTSTTKLADSCSQSFCGGLVSNLKSKMGMSLLPPSTSSFRLEPDREALETITQGNGDMVSAIYAKLSSVTANINKEIEAQQMRDSVFDLLTQLIVVGSVVIEKVKDDGIKIHPLRNFTVDLDSRGEARAMCIMEKIKDLPEGISPSEEKDEYDLYTLIERNWDDKKWYMTQSIEDEIVGKEQKFTDYSLPFQYIGWTWIVGDTYHRPYAEDFIDDIEQYDALARVLTQGSIIASKALIFVDQKGNRTKIKDVSDSENGDIINGRADDVTAFQLQKNFDFQVPMARLQEIGKHLSKSFLDSQSVTRDAERVTAQEIQYMAQELEKSSLSGVYSKLAKKLSKRIVEWIMQEINIKFDGISINVITGLDALGRSQEAQKLDAYMQRMGAMGMIDMFNKAELAIRYASFDGIDTTGLLKPPSQIAQEQQQAQQQAAMAQGDQALAQSAGQAMGEHLAPQG